MNIRIIVLIWLVFLASCNTEEEKRGSVSLFQELSPKSHNIDFSNKLEFTSDLNIIEYLYFNNGGGVAIGDIDNDGLEDVFLTGNQSADRLYKNLGNLVFEDISQSAGIEEDLNWSTGVTIDDINNDGYKDIYICKVAPISADGTHNLLYINDQNGSFKEMSAEYGLDFSGYSTQASFFDYDKDGDLDVYLLNHSVHSTKSYGPIKKRMISDLQSGDRLLENQLNQKSNKFVDVTSKSGIYSSALGYGLGVVTADLNNDGWTDIYVGNDFHDNDYIYINNRDGTFKESVNEMLTHCSQFSMGVDVADISGDGLNDIFTTDMMPHDSKIMLKSGGNDTEQIVEIKRDFGYLPQYSRNMLQVNNGRNQFIEKGLASKTFASDWSWSVLLQDFDNSGTTDIFITNGIINRPNDLDYIDYINIPENRKKEDEDLGAFNKRLIDQMPTLKLSNLLFTQNSAGVFSDIQSAQIGSPNYSNGAAYGDFDLDGDVDIIVNNLNGPISLLKNVASEHHHVSFDLGNAKNAKVEVWSNDQVQSKEYSTTRGYQSASSHYLYFGIGKAERIDSVRVFWPDGTLQVETEVPVDELVILEKSKDARTNESSNKNQQDEKLSIVEIVHKENYFNDLNNEPLMPYRISQEGPAVLYEDFDNDNFRDLFLGASKGDAGQFYRGTEQLNFQKREIKAFLNDRKYEDVAAGILDFNADGFNDIYVVSAGNEHSEQHENLEDRIYLNNRNGDFLRIPISLPLTNGSCVAVADYNNDGFDDFFVGTRNIPGAFGVSPVSFLIKNVQGQKLEIAARMRFGMVTDAIWYDVDDNTTAELCVLTEWGPLKILSMDHDSSITDLTEHLGIPDIRGIFKSIEIADVNGDKKPDFFLGNIGLNTAWHMNDGDSITMNLLDIDNNTFIDPIIFRDYLGDKTPFADKMTLKSQVPSINKIFPSYQAYSTFSTIDQLELPDQEPSIRPKSINTLSSVLLLSDSTGYEVVNLPKEVQISNIEDMLWIDSGAFSGSLIYVGNCDSRSHHLGQTLSSSGGILSNFDIDSKQFLTHRNLSLPLGITSKKIIQISEDSFLIINNDNVQYLIEL